MNVRRSAYRIPGGSMLKFTKTDRENTNNNEMHEMAVLSFLQRMGEFLEIVAAIFMCIEIMIAMIKMVPIVQQFWHSHSLNTEFDHFTKNLFNIVIGIEFMKMLCRPNADNILETLIFLVARHMIVAQTTPVQDLISTVSIVILLLAKRFIQDPKCFFPGRTGRSPEQPAAEPAAYAEDKD